MSKSTSTLAESLLTLVFAFFVLQPIGWVVTGWVGSTVWNWFAAPALNAPTLTLLQATGIAFVVGAFTPSPPFDKNRKEPTLGESTIHSIAILIAKVLGLGIAWLFHTFCVS